MLGGGHDQDELPKDKPVASPRHGERVRFATYDVTQSHQSGLHSIYEEKNSFSRLQCLKALHIIGWLTRRYFEGRISFGF